MELKLNLPHPVVVLDTETGGLNPDDELMWSLDRSNYKIGSAVEGKLVKLAAPILEIGAVKLSPIDLSEISVFHAIAGKEEGETFKEFISRCSSKALEVNGFKDRLDELKKAPPLSQVLRDFSKWLPQSGNRVGKFIPCGQNVRFDLDMINLACQRYGIDFQIKSQPLELTSYSQLYFGLRDTEILANYKLTTVAQALRIPTKDAHTALADVRMTAACMKKMFSRFATS